MTNKENQILIMQGIIEILESLRSNPNDYTKKRLVKKMSAIAYPSKLFKTKE